MRRGRGSSDRPCSRSVYGSGSAVALPHGRSCRRRRSPPAPRRRRARAAARPRPAARAAAHVAGADRRPHRRSPGAAGSPPLPRRPARSAPCPPSWRRQATAASGRAPASAKSDGEHRRQRPKPEAKANAVGFSSSNRGRRLQAAVDPGQRPDTDQGQGQLTRGARRRGAGRRWLRKSRLSHGRDEPALATVRSRRRRARARRRSTARRGCRRRRTAAARSRRRACARSRPARPGRARRAASPSAGAAQRDSTRLGGVAHLGGDVEDGDVAQHRDRLAVADPLQRRDQVKAAGRRRRVHRGLDLRDRGAPVARRADRSRARPAHRCGGPGC